MGMYDTFGSDGDQLKIFHVPIYYFSPDHYKKYKENKIDHYKFLGYMGGNLRNYSVGNKVPWRYLSYNYSKSFIVVDIGYFDENPIIFSFIEGKFSGYSEYNLESKTFEHYIDIDLNKQTVFDAFGNMYTTKDIDSLILGLIKEYESRLNIVKKYSQKRSLPFSNEFIKEETNELNENKEKWLGHFLPHKDDIRIQDKYKDYGAYVELVNRHYNDPRYNGVFNEALLNEAHAFVNKNNIDIEFYFCWNDTPYEDRQWIRKIDEIIRKG